MVASGAWLCVCADGLHQAPVASEMLKLDDTHMQVIP